MKFSLMWMVRTSFLGCIEVQGVISGLLLEYEFHSLYLFLGGCCTCKRLIHIF